MDVLALAARLTEAADPTGPLATCWEILDDAGFALEAPLPGTLVASRGEGGVVLSGHLDVVPAGDGWTTPPFGSAPEKGVLTARGASDMRGPVSAMLVALARSGAPARVVLTTDEETTMEAARALAAGGLVDDAPLVVVGEPTGLAVGTCGKGVAWLALEVAGDRGHASVPRDARGPSAPERLVATLARLDEGVLPWDHPVLGSATVALSGLGSEETPFNVLAGRAWARLDCRFPHPGTPEEARRRVAEALDLTDVGARLTLEKEEPPFEGAQELGVALAARLTKAGLASKAGGVSFASEAGHWGPRAPTLVCGPGDIGRAHAGDEHVTRDELEAGVRAYETILAWVAEGLLRP